MTQLRVAIDEYTDERYGLVAAAFGPLLGATDDAVHIPPSPCAPSASI